MYLTSVVVVSICVPNQCGCCQYLMYLTSVVVVSICVPNQCGYCQH